MTIRNGKELKEFLSSPQTIGKSEAQELKDLYGGRFPLSKRKMLQSQNVIRVKPRARFQRLGLWTVSATLIWASLAVIVYLLIFK